MSDGFVYINNYYKVNAEIGRRVIADGKPGVITGAEGAHIVVNLDSDKPGVRTFWHPTWKMQYGEIGTVRKMTPGQKRYQDYLKSESNCTFAEWLGVDKQSKDRREWHKKWCS